MAYAALDADLPLALLPVRIETRFMPADQPTELWVRLFPDTIHADGHRETLTDLERDLGRACWEQSWRAGPDITGQAAAFSWLSDQLGAWRAAFVLEAMAPTNPANAPARPVPPDQPLKPPPLFPKPTGGGPPQPVRARLLPERFALVAYQQEVLSGPYWGAEIPDGLAMAPAPVELEGVEDAGARALLAASGLTWTYDFEEAERVGMGVRIDLTPFPASTRRRGFSELIAFGVRAGASADPLESLLRAHRYTHGLDLIPQGTPTNRTESAGPGLSPESPDPAEVRRCALAVGSAKRPHVAAEGDLFRLDGSDALGAALGLGPDNALDRATNADSRELAFAEAINRTLWPALGGFTTDSVLDGVLSAEQRGWLREWSTRFVRGSAMLPTLLVGPQPYGVQPATLVGRPTEPSTEIEHLQVVLAELRSSWEGSVPDVPRLDPEWTDRTGDPGAEAGLVSQVLGALPHLSALAVRRVDPLRSRYRGELSERLGSLALACSTAYDQEWPAEDYEDLTSWSVWLRCEAALDAATTLQEQQAAFEAAADELEGLATSGEPLAYYRGWAAWVRDALGDFARAHAERVAPAQWLVDRVTGVTGLLGSLGDPNAFTTACPEPDGVPWRRPLVADHHDDAAVQDLGAWLAAVATDLTTGTSADQPSDALPMLRQLAAWSASRATDPADLALLRDGVGRDGSSGLREVTSGVADPVAELERLLREALGPWSYRLDAWYTGVAAWRLERQRVARTQGIQTGAFGWVVDVRPRQGPASQGYVLAPSLAHATTAAILRSGWAAFGGDAEHAGLATNLSSERLRRASTIIDGVREGHDLARLLGAMLERRLGDADLDRYVADVRQAVLSGLGDPAAPNAVVDGLLVARARSDATDLDATEEAVRDALAVTVDGAGVDARAIGAVLAESSRDLDAVADAAVAQSVFSLAQGNTAEATATLSAASTGEVTFPRLRVADTPREAQTVTSRFLLCVDPDATSSWPGAATSGRALAAPGLEGWLSGLLGDGGYDFAVSFVAPTTGVPLAEPSPHTLDELGLAALDVVFLAPAGAELGLGRLGALVATWAEGRRPAGLDRDAEVRLDATVGDRPLADLVVAVAALRRLLAAGRDLDARDLAAPGSEAAVSGLDSDDLGRRLDDVRGALGARRAELATALSEGRDVRTALLALAGFDLGDVPPRLTPEQLAMLGGRVLDQIDGRIAALDARTAADQAAWAGWDPLARTGALRDRIGLLVGHTLPVAPRFRAPNGAELDATFGRGREGTREQASGWLAAAGRIEPGAQRLRLAVDLVEALRDDVLVDVAVGQLPDHPDEAWAALERPGADERSRLCLFAVGTQPAFGSVDAAGVVFGALDESLPVGRPTAGLAVHFDAPSARAPQAVLLCTTDRAAWDVELVRDTIRQTLDLARLRMLDLSLLVPGPDRPVPSAERPPGIGQYLPATSLPLDVDAGGAG